MRTARYIRTVVDGKLVVRRPGDHVEPELAVRLGLQPEVKVRQVTSDSFLPMRWR